MLWYKVGALPNKTNSTNQYNVNLARYRDQFFQSLLPKTEWDTKSTLIQNLWVVPNRETYTQSSIHSNRSALYNLIHCNQWMLYGELRCIMGSFINYVTNLDNFWLLPWCNVKTNPLPSLVDIIYRLFSICSLVGLRPGFQMSRHKTIDERSNLFDHFIEYLPQ